MVVEGYYDFTSVVRIYYAYFVGWGETFFACHSASCIDESYESCWYLPLLREVRRIYPDLSIWCFTGYLFDKDIVERMCNEWKETKEMLQYIDVIVDGKYEEDKKDMMLQFKGSSNQRTILVKESLESGNIVLLYD
jgi:hypothetical protein